MPSCHGAFATAKTFGVFRFPHIKGNSKITDISRRLLLGNAVPVLLAQKVAENEKITIDLQTNGNVLNCIDYRDTGLGIESSLIESAVIFEPQFSTKPDGTGLGLAIVGEAQSETNLN